MILSGSSRNLLSTPKKSATWYNCPRSMQLQSIPFILVIKKDQNYGLQTYGKNQIKCNHPFPPGPSTCWSNEWTQQPWSDCCPCLPNLYSILFLKSHTDISPRLLYPIISLSFWPRNSVLPCLSWNMQARYEQKLQTTRHGCTMSRTTSMLIKVFVFSFFCPLISFNFHIMSVWLMPPFLISIKQGNTTKTFSGSKAWHSKMFLDGCPARITLIVKVKPCPEKGMEHKELLARCQRG